MNMQRMAAVAVFVGATAFGAAGLAGSAFGQQFRQGVCGGLICDFNLEGGKTEQQVEAEARAHPQNCGGIMCDLGTRAFPTQAELDARQAEAQQQAAPPVDPVPPPKKAKRKHVAKAKMAEPAAAAAPPEPKPN